MRKLILILVLALVILSISMSSFSKATVHDIPCEGMYTLECKLIDDMKKKYRSTQLKHINDKLAFDDGKGDAQAVWLSLKVLEQFICQIQSKKPASVRSEDLGIRFYYAAYPEKDKWDSYTDLKTKTLWRKHKIPVGYEERHTVVLVPTFTTNDDTIKDLFLQGQSGILAITPGVSDNRRPARNHGSLFPPRTLFERKCSIE